MSSPHIDPTLASALAARGYDTLTPVQLAVLEPQTAGRDLLVSAKTGSGKTVAYGLALAGTLMGPNGALPSPGGPLALVIAPTRELAMQVRRELQWLYAAARVVSCVGGMDPRAEARAMQAGCHIVVGTPGRLRDHIERGQLNLDELLAVVLDEADEMLDLGFREELEEILDAAPKERRTLLFSATLPKPIVAMARTYQNDALRLIVGAGEEAHGDIDYRALRISPSEVELATVNVLRYFESGSALVFCATREAVRRLHANLVERGFSVVALSGELTQNERTRALQSLRDGRARVCVATDVAARGIDIPDLDLVIHADLPRTREVLQHRSGRTGRAGRKGTSVILVPHPRWKRMQQLLNGAGLDVTWENPPSAEAIRARDLERMIEEVPEVSDAAEDELVAVNALVAARSPEAIAAAYVRLARTRSPSPEDLSDTVAPEPRAYVAGEARVPEAPRAGFEDAVWFKVDLGRNRNAEARWLLPLLCRRGHVTKRDIGAIRIFDRETRFQITAEAAERFEAAAAKGDADGGRITRLDPNTPMPDERGGRPERRPPFPRKPPAKTARPEGAERPWTPPLRGDEARPPKSGKPKPSKKRKSNG